MPLETIARLYAALGERDGEGAAACYTDDATFRDPAFGQLDPGEVKDMWRMLCERSHDLEVTLVDSGEDSDGGWARWAATYTFTGTGRNVLNDIHARFRFRDDLIADQVDTFSLRHWGSQALGRRGAIMGTTPLLGYVVRRQARRGLDAYRR
jgi:ketosteroid isomerase-like protein